MLTYVRRMLTYAYVSIRQHAYESEKQKARASPLLAYVSIRQHTSAYVSIRQHTSADVSIRVVGYLLGDSQTTLRRLTYADVC
jgi:hypothetical protein